MVRTELSPHRGVDRATWLWLGCVYVTWGTAFLAVDVLVRSLPPLTTSAVRFAVAGGVLLAVVGVQRGWDGIVPTWREAAGTAAVAILLIPAANGLVVLAQRTLPSGLTALIGSSGPVWIVALRVTHGDRPARRTVASVVVGLAGLWVLTGGGRAAHVTLGAVTLVVLAALAGSLGSFYSTRVALPRDALVAAGWEMLVGAVVLGVTGVASGERAPAHLAAVPVTAWLALGWLVVGCSLLGFSAYTHLLATAPLSLVSTTSYATPCISVVLGAAVLGEPVGLRTFLGGAVVLASCVVLQRAEAAGRRRPPDCLAAEVSGAGGPHHPPRQEDDT